MMNSYGISNQQHSNKYFFCYCCYIKVIGFSHIFNQTDRSLTIVLHESEKHLNLMDFQVCSCIFKYYSYATRQYKILKIPMMNHNFSVNVKCKCIQWLLRKLAQILQSTHLYITTKRNSCFFKISQKIQNVFVHRKRKMSISI